MATGDDAGFIKTWSATVDDKTCGLDAGVANFRHYRHQPVNRGKIAGGKKMGSTQDWKYSSVLAQFGEKGCSISGCSYSHPEGCSTDQVHCCALNLSDAIIKAGYGLPAANNVNYCDHTGSSGKRVRNADGMARVTRAQNNGNIDASTWADRPSWKGIVFFEGGLSLTSIYEKAARAEHAPSDFAKAFAVTGHIDLWDGTKGVHATYADATTIWFWRLG